MNRIFNLFFSREALIIMLLLHQVTEVYGQVECTHISKNYSGVCEGYDPIQGYRYSRSYKYGKLNGVSQETYREGQIRYTAKYSKGLINGKFVAYYETGEKMTVGKFRSGSGKFTMYHPNGEKKIAGEFHQGEVDGIWISYDETGAFQDTLGRNNLFAVSMLNYLVGDAEIGASRDDFFDQMFDLDNFFGESSDSMFSNFQNQINDAMQKMQRMFEEMDFADTAIHFNFSDSIGGYQHFEFFDGLGDKRFSKRIDGLVDFPDVEPRFPGGEKARDEFILNTIQYPDEAKKLKEDATIFIEVIIDFEGAILEPQIVLGGLRVLEVEAIRVVKSMPNWIPAKHDNERVKTRTIIPVPFNSLN